MYVCTNTTFPKWKHVASHPYIAIGTFSREDRLAFRLQAEVERFENKTDFCIQAWNELPQYQQKNYWAMTESSGPADLKKVPPIFGCMKLKIQSWIIDETGEDDWIVKRRIYNLVDNAWKEHAAEIL